MASNCSFDVVSEVNLQEVENAVNQAKKEIAQRYDFKGSKAEIKWDKEDIKILAEDDFRVKSIIDVLQDKMVKRSVSIKSLKYEKMDTSGGMVRQVIKIQMGISKEKSKEIISAIKESKLKIQAQIMDDKVRITSKKIDSLQEVMQMLKEKDFDVALQFTNYRS
ncbi:YajQ family cyclic di-GMP-binding protein [Marinisporobacter balticus]|uniref:Nucleotide-binding protein EV214_1125 n=1 Tax=Marinisporobacter balticus TaxID=2018667 RepID=A0A4V2SB84_9FIRM|nr:YajQ family cyclic di-GMP-binding protein [Marinisporobacter balticus]TCO74530.1 hypothetical protein EV214_1125 [Marinisporobacter balticus]